MAKFKMLLLIGLDLEIENLVALQVLQNPKVVIKLNLKMLLVL
jgi:hypothetical protein